MKYFAVNKSVKMLKKTYRPCISYKLIDQVKPMVEALEKAGKAVIRDRVIVFQNGSEITPARYVETVPEKVANSKVTAKLSTIKKSSSKKSTSTSSTTPSSTSTDSEETT